MPRFAYDFHLHSCLSPCGDADMTPNNLVNMAKLKGLDVIALTDHNTAKNCPAALAAGARAGLLVLPGMELCTAEDIHCVCLFETLEGAMAFGAYVREKLPRIQNRPDIFGEQLILDGDDNITGHEELLLINAAAVAVDDVNSLCARYGGTAFPAHVDKIANGILGVLGAVPMEAGFKSAEISSHGDADDLKGKNPSLKTLSILRDSDAHYLWDISERENFIELEELSARAVIDAL